MIKLKLKHLQFTDDALIFIPRKIEIVRNYLRIIDVFNIMSGTKLIYEKSSVISWCDSDLEWCEQVTRWLGCKCETCPIQYLGLSLGANPKRVKTWGSVVNKIEDRLGL